MTSPAVPGTWICTGRSGVKRVITIAEKSAIIWKPALKLELKSHRSSTIIKEFFPYTRRNR